MDNNAENRKRIADLKRSLENSAMESDGREGLGGPYMELNSTLLIENVARECAKLVFNGNPEDGQRLKIGTEILNHFGLTGKISKDNS